MGHHPSTYPDGKKHCGVCNRKRDLMFFGVTGKKTWTLRSNCFECEKKYQTAAEHTWQGWAKRRLSSCRGRAKRKGIPCTITQRDVLELLPKDLKCPVLGIKMQRGNRKDHSKSPSLDEVVPGKGYVPGNVVVVSNKANTWKSSMAPADIKKLWKFYRKFDV